MTNVLQPWTYGIQVGDAWVSIDFQVQALSISKDRRPGVSVRTEDLGNGFLIDRNADGEVIAVEVLAASGGRET